MSKSLSKSVSKSLSSLSSLTSGKSVSKGDMKNIRNVFLVLLIVLYVCFNYKYPCSKRLCFLLVSTILTFYLFNDVCSAIILSIVLSMAFTLICKRGNLVEGLENQKDTKNKEDLTDDNEDLTDDNEDLTNDKEYLTNDKEDLTNDKEDLTNDKEDENVNILENLEDVSNGSFSDNYIDYNKTMRNNLKKIDTKNIEKMTNETKELLNTQKELMDTMKQMAPLLKQGMNMVDMFKKDDKK